jgi:hypothetical protein
VDLHQRAEKEARAVWWGDGGGAGGNRREREGGEGVAGAKMENGGGHTVKRGRTHGETGADARGAEESTNGFLSPLHSF